MKPVDFVKALGAAILVMALDLCAAYAFVTVWTSIDKPDHALTYTDPLVIELSSLSTRIFCPILLTFFVWLFSRKRPDRNAYAFALAVFGFYMLIDWGLVSFQGIMEPAVLLTATLKLLGAMVGAWLSRLGGTNR